MVRYLLTIVAGALFLASPNMAGAAEPFSPWVEVAGSRSRLIASWPRKDEAIKAAVQMQFLEGWKTYWINPGPSGIPPKMDFSGSENLAKAEPLWPAPYRLKDGDSEIAGYEQIVFYPLRIIAEDPAKPVIIRAKIEYGLCEKICVPAQSDLELALTPDIKPDAMTNITMSRDVMRLPKPVTVGDESAFGITAVERSGDSLIITVDFSEGPANFVRDLFAKADGYNLPLPKHEGGDRYSLALPTGDKPKVIDLVAVSGGVSKIASVSLDDLPAKP